MANYYGVELTKEEVEVLEDIKKIVSILDC
jgi:hypothetical protein